MPISSVASPTLCVAYRPVLLQVIATATDGTPVPPVVYCDIYFNGTFYKTAEKTQFKSNNGSDSTWEFDIQDACQEFLSKFLEINGNEAILTADPIIVQVTCLFRSSVIDVDGFIQPEGTVPIQGTSDSAPVAGTGATSDDFWVFNGTIQHEESQVVTDQLAFYERRGTWRTPGTYPLSHRPLHYYVCVGDNDSFPILSDLAPDNIRLWYRLPDDTDFTMLGDGITPCIPVSFAGTPLLPDAIVDEFYEYIINLNGTAPFSFLDEIVNPAWMTVEISGSQVILSGTPSVGDVGTGITVSFQLQNCAGVDDIPFDQTLNVVDNCVPIGSPGDFTSGAVVGSLFTLSISLTTGTAPFTIDSFTLPSWVTASIVGTNLLVLTGTPDTPGVDTWAIDISNDCGSATVTGTITTTEAGRSVIVLNQTGSLLELKNANGTLYSIPAGTNANFKMQTTLFHIQTMTGSHSVDILTSLPSTILMSIPSASAGNDYNSTDLTLTNYLRFNA